MISSWTFRFALLLATMATAVACGDEDACSDECQAACESGGGTCVDETENDDGSVHCECRSTN